MHEFNPDIAAKRYADRKRYIELLQKDQAETLRKIDTEIESLNNPDVVQSLNDIGLNAREYLMMLRQTRNNLLGTINPDNTYEERDEFNS